jgi:hypothetical protein
MKKLLLGSLLLLSTLSSSQQTEFKFTKNGFTDFVVTQVDGKTQSDLYKKVLDWVQVTYRNPKEVLKAQIENDYVRIEGSKSNSLCTKALGMATCWDIRYQIEIYVKDGKYKFDVIRLEFYLKATQYSSGGWYDFPINGTDYSAYYKESGEIKNAYKLYPEGLETTFNSLNTSLKSFILDEEQTKKSSEW